MHSKFQSQIEVSGQPHKPSILLLVKELKVPIKWEARWIPEQVWTQEINFWPLPKIGHPICQSCSQSPTGIKKKSCNMQNYGNYSHPPSCKMGTGSFSGVKCGRGMLLTTHPLLVLWSWKSKAIPLPTLWATPGLKRDHFTFTFMVIITSGHLAII